MLQLLIRRYFQDDLKADAYINALGRVVSVALLVGIMSLVWPSEWPEQLLIAMAFIVGLFP